MKLKFYGSVCFANGAPASSVSVHIFDKDTAGKGDDDLTITPGLSDAQGYFSLVYEPLRYLDYLTVHLPGTHDPSIQIEEDEPALRMPDLGDMYLPYLKFNYTYNGLNREHTASLGIFKTRFFLPVNPPVDFLPSRNGFKFRNKFSGYFLPYSTPAFMSSPKVTSQYGLCGGMCAVVYDFILSGRPIPKDIEVPHQGTRLQRYLFQRQMDSLGGLGQQVVKVAQWTSLPDDTLVGTMRRTADEFNQVRQKLDEGNLVLLALIYDRANSLRELSKVIFNNHQVLAYACQQAADSAPTLSIYDPNLPGQDSVVIQCEPVVVGEEILPGGSAPVTGYKSTQLVGGEFYKAVRGFFEMPYTPVKPPKNL